MAIFEEIGKVLTPHAEKLNKNIMVQGQLIHNKLARIEKAVSDLGRADFGDKWLRLRVTKIAGGEESFEIGVVPQNEVWLIQYIVVDGVTSKNPAFILEAGNSLIAVVGKEENANIKTSGDAVALPGEKVVILARAAGSISASINIIRKMTPVVTQHDEMRDNPDTELWQSETTHDPDRDVIASPNGQYQEKPSELNQPGLIVPSILNE